jgi:hypothetical protein
MDENTPAPVGALGLFTVAVTFASPSMAGERDTSSRGTSSRSSLEESLKWLLSREVTRYHTKETRKRLFPFLLTQVGREKNKSVIQLLYEYHDFGSIFAHAAMDSTETESNNKANE